MISESQAPGRVPSLDHAEEQAAARRCTSGSLDAEESSEPMRAVNGEPRSPGLREQVKRYSSGVFGSTIKVGVKTDSIDSAPEEEVEEARVAAGAEDDENPLHSSPMRWAALAVFCLSTLMESLNGVIYPPIALNVSELWGVSYNAVNAITQVSLILPFCLYFYAMYFADRHAIEHSYYISVVFNLLGSALRYALPVEGAEGYYVALGTQVIISLTHPFIIVLPARVSTHFFPMHQRALATTAGVLFSQLGYGAGLVIAPMFGNDLQGLYLLHFIASAVPVVISLCVFDPRKLLSCAPDPALVRVQAEQQGPQESFCAVLWRLAKDGAFVRLMLSASLTVAVVQTWISVIQLTAQPTFHSPGSIMLIAGLFFGCGVFGALIAGVWMDKSQDPVKVGRGLIAVAYPCGAVCLVGWFLDNAIMVYVGIACSAASGFGLLALAIELGIEYAFRPGGRSEATVTGINHMVTSAMTAVLIFMSTPGNMFSTARWVPIFWLAIFTVSAAGFYTLPKRYLRQQAHREAREAKQLEADKRQCNV